MSPDEPARPIRDRPLAAVLPGRLAAVPGAPASLPAALQGERYDALRTRAVEWQQFSGEGWFWEMAAADAVEAAAYALAGQMGSVGEQLALAYGASVEVALWEARQDTDEVNVVREMSLRAMAEAQSLFVIGAGHALANVAVRALTLRVDLRTALGAAFQRGAADAFAPFSDQRKDWISLNDPACDKLERVAIASKSTTIAALIAPIVQYGRGPEWRSLIDRRGADFHRWRLQTHGIAGVAPESPWTHHPATATSPGERVLQLGPRPYVVAEGLGAEVARIATGGMFALADAMARFTSALEKALVELREPPGV